MNILFSSVQFLSHIQLFMIPWIVACQASLSINKSQNLLKFMSIECGNAIQPSHPLSSTSPLAFNVSQHQMSQFFTSGGRSIGVSALASGLPMYIQDWFPLGWTSLGWISLLSKGLSRVFSNTTVQKHQFFDTQLSL